MSRYLINTTETFRVDSEEEAKALIEEAKHESISNLVKYSCVRKEQKQKGEVVQSWYRVTLTKSFTDEREPEEEITITYGRD